MRYLLFFLIFLPGGSQSFAQKRAIITFKYPKAEIGKTKSFNVPLEDGRFLYLNLVKETVDESGGIRLNLKLSGPGIINVEYLTTSVEIYVEPGAVMSVDFSSGSAQFSGNLAQENAMLNRLNWTGLAFATSDALSPPAMKELNKIDSPDILLGAVDILIANAEKSLSSQLSVSFSDFMKPNIRLYYYDVAYASIQRRFLDYTFQTSRPDSSIINSPWGKTLSHVAQLSSELWNDQSLRISQWYFSSIYNYTMRYRMSFLKENLAVANASRSKIGTFNYNLFQGAVPTAVSKYLTDRQAEFFIPNYLAYYITGNATYYSKEMLTMYDKYRKGFPSSIYLNPLEKKVATVKLYVDGMKATEIEADVHILPDHNNINTMSDMLKDFKGRVVYVDIWATWCGPCRKEFSSYDQLYELQRKNTNFVILFLSRDEAADEKKWKDFIHANKLYGFHAIPNENLEAELRSKINWTGIPRYVIIGKEGAIVDADASPPSSGQTIISQLTEMLLPDR